jgi:hypothetical protein
MHIYRQTTTMLGGWNLGEEEELSMEPLDFKKDINQDSRSAPMDFFSRTRKRHAHLFIKKEEKKDPKWISTGRPSLRWSKTKKQKYIHK